MNTDPIRCRAVPQTLTCMFVYFKGEKKESGIEKYIKNYLLKTYKFCERNTQRNPRMSLNLRRKK